MALPAALLGSLLLHLAVVIAVFVDMGGGHVGGTAAETMPPEEQRLGVEASDAVTITWIGFKDPTPHTGVQAQHDQAQVTIAAGEAAANQVAASSAQAIETVARASQAASASAVQAAERLNEWADRLRDAARVARRQREADASAERARQASEARRRAEQAQETSPRGDTGLADNRESDATAVDPTMDYRPGQPLARQGLQIRTIRPVFDSTTRLLDLRALRAAPTVSITFARDGTVLRAGFVNGTATGRVAVDDPILNAVHAWTAAGSDLEAIPENDPTAGVTVEIRFRF
ncbi:MAG: hypothetical protein AAGF47_01215 [Planctomycetota bacterium]